MVTITVLFKIIATLIGILIISILTPLVIIAICGFTISLYGFFKDQIIDWQEKRGIKSIKVNEQDMSLIIDGVWMIYYYQEDYEFEENEIKRSLELVEELNKIYDNKFKTKRIKNGGN